MVVVMVMMMMMMMMVMMVINRFDYVNVIVTGIVHIVNHQRVSIEMYY